MPRCGVCRTSVFATNDALCTDCGEAFCPDHVDSDAHGCGVPKERGDNHPDPSVSDADLKDDDPDPESTENEAPPTASGSVDEESSTNLIDLLQGASSQLLASPSRLPGSALSSASQ